MKRVEVTKPVLGLCYMQVCAVGDATDAEILAHCNLTNPSGVTGGWSLVKRVSGNPNHSPVPCDIYEGRTHYIVAC